MFHADENSSQKSPVHGSPMTPCIPALSIIRKYISFVHPLYQDDEEEKDVKVEKIIPYHAVMRGRVEEPPVHGFADRKRNQVDHAADSKTDDPVYDCKHEPYIGRQDQGGVDRWQVNDSIWLGKIYHPSSLSD